MAGIGYWLDRKYNIMGQNAQGDFAKALAQAEAIPMNAQADMIRAEAARGGVANEAMRIGDQRLLEGRRLDLMNQGMMSENDLRRRQGSLIDTQAQNNLRTLSPDVADWLAGAYGMKG